jgi:hypothetical protein
MGPAGPHWRSSLGGARRQASRPRQGRGVEGGERELEAEKAIEQRSRSRSGRAGLDDA